MSISVLKRGLDLLNEDLKGKQCICIQNFSRLLALASLLAHV